MEGPLKEDEQRVMDEFSSKLDQSTIGDRAEQSFGSKKERSKTPEKSEGEPWRRAVKRLYRTVLSVSDSTNSAYANPEDALNALLEAVANNENVSERDLLKKLQHPIADEHQGESGDDSLLTTDGHSPPTTLTTTTTGNETDDYETEAEEERESNRHEFLERLRKVGKTLSEGGRSGMQDIDEMIFKEDVATKFQSAIEYVTTKLQGQWDYILNLAMPQQQLQTLIFVSVLQVISIQRVFSFVPLLVCYASFLIMIYSTLAMFGSRTWLKRAENWRRLLTVFQKSRRLSTDDRGGGSGEARNIDDGSFYSWRSTEPYATFFISLGIFVFSMALIRNEDGNGDGIALPNSWSMCAIGVFFALLCFLALADRHDKLAVWVMLLDLISALPPILLKFGVKTANVPVIGLLLANREIYHIGLIRIQVGLPSLAILATIGVYAFMVTAYPRRDIFTVVVPHVVCLAWWHLSLELFLINDLRSIFTSIGWYDVFLTFGVIWLITFPTMAALVMVVGVVAAQLRNVFDLVSLTKAAITASILLLPFLYRKLRQLAERKNWTTTTTAGAAKPGGGGGQWKTTALMLMVYGFLVFASAAVLYESRFTTGDGMGGKLAKELTWTQFEKACSYGDENLGNRLDQQIACSQLRNTMVDWKGSVQAVRVAKIDNVFENVLSYLPDELASRLRCVYGERINETSANIGSNVGSCTLIKHNVYTFELDVAGPWGQHTLSSAKGTVVLIASATFQELVTEFEQGDVVEFLASFSPDSLLKYPPKLKLVQLQCLACQNVSPEKHAVRYMAPYTGTIWSKLFNACCFLFNFVCSPLFVVG